MLALCEESLVPPENVARKDVVNAEWRMEFDVVQTLREEGHEVRALGVGSELGVIRAAIAEFKPDIAFNLLEGFAEVASWDQNVVAYLELLRLPYTGSNSRGLLLSRDKALAKKVLSYHRVAGADFVVFPRARTVRRPAAASLPPDRQVADPRRLDRHLPGLGGRGRREARRARALHPREHRHRRPGGGVHRGTRALRRDPGQPAPPGAARSGSCPSRACPRRRARSPPSG